MRLRSYTTWLCECGSAMRVVSQELTDNPRQIACSNADCDKFGKLYKEPVFEAQPV